MLAKVVVVVEVCIVLLLDLICVLMLARIKRYTYWFVITTSTLAANDKDRALAANVLEQKQGQVGRFHSPTAGTALSVTLTEGLCVYNHQQGLSVTPAARALDARTREPRKLSVRFAPCARALAPD